MTDAVRAVELTKLFDGLRAVDSVSFEVPQGEVFGYLGRNGAGKTTTVRMLCTLLPPTAGRAEVAGYVVGREPLEIRARIGVLHETTPTHRGLWTAEEYLSYCGALYGLAGDGLDSRIGGLLGTFDLVDEAQRSIGEFSLGMRRRLEICRALIHDPEVLFLDEPTKELDIPGKRRMWNLLKEFSEEGKTIFLTTHDIRDVEELCTQLAVISRGRLTYKGALEGITERVHVVSCDADERLSEILMRAGISAKVAVEQGVVALSSAELLEPVHGVLRQKGYRVYDVLRPRTLEECLISLM